ncbi:MAG TPA: (2Fe-2S)-binding protein [Candidatus Omnitrophica bacterium]|nr:(2Fe-2S)-binding protein [Candidatus Omnitrophota bacterium]
MRKEKNSIICRCEELREREIVEVIKSGASDIDTVKRILRACMGLCQGKVCGYLIARIISRETGKPLCEIFPIKPRPPVRPVQIKTLGEGGVEK